MGALMVHPIPGLASIVALILVAGDALAQACVPGDTTMCLNRDEFAVSVTWRDPVQDVIRDANVVKVTEDTGTFWFFRAEEPEGLVKVLDGTPLNQHYWVFAGGLGPFDTDLLVTRSASGEQAAYRIAGDGGAVVFDLQAFPAAPAARRMANPVPAGPTGCTASDEVACLHGGRFAIEVDWSTPSSSGAGSVTPYSDVATFFHFFTASNLELLLRILDTGPPGGGVSIRLLPLTNTDFSLRITDSGTGETVLIEQVAEAEPQVQTLEAFEVIHGDGFEAF